MKRMIKLMFGFLLVFNSGFAKAATSSNDDKKDYCAPKTSLKGLYEVCTCHARMHDGNPDPDSDLENSINEIEGDAFKNDPLTGRTYFFNNSRLSLVRYS